LLWFPRLAVFFSLWDQPVSRRCDGFSQDRPTGFFVHRYGTVPNRRPIFYFEVAMDEQASYLSDPSFSEQHRGPHNVDDNGCIHDRDPSPEQIAAMRLAIRRAVPRQMVGESSAPCAVPMVSEEVFHVRTADRFL
jgi:hypothetical protein